VRPEAGEVLALALDRPARLGTSARPVRLVCVDGPAGSGKTTMAADVEAAATARHVSARVVHMDDLYAGWGGLAAAPGTVARDLVGPLREGRPGGYRRYDWVTARFAEWVEVPPVPLLVLEGVGSGSPAYADAVTLLVWVEAPQEVRLARGVARDGERLRRRWEAWQSDEERHFARASTRDRADMIITSAASAG
jgi:uridine kinase